MIKINFFDRCFARNKRHIEHLNKCSGVHDKETKTVKYVSDGSGIVDIFTDHMMEEANSFGKSKTRIGWIQEVEAIRSSWYKKMRSNKDYYFNDLKFDFIYTYDDSIINLDPRFKRTIGMGFWIKNKAVHKKSKLVSMIVSNKRMCHYHNKRLEYKEKFKKDVDLFGRGHKEISLKEEGLCDYMFSFAMENDIKDTLMTEKVFDCFATGTIPIYMGTRKIINYFNEDGIIFLDDSFDIKSLSPELYYSKIDAVRDNFERVLNYEIPMDYYFKDVLCSGH